MTTFEKQKAYLTGWNNELKTNHTFIKPANVNNTTSVSRLFISCRYELITLTNCTSILIPFTYAMTYVFTNNTSPI